MPDDRTSDVHRCVLAMRLGQTAPCPPGGCTLLRSLGFDPPALTPRERPPAGDTSGPRYSDLLCPIEEIAGLDPIVCGSLNELRMELRRFGPPRSGVHARRTRALRHE